MNINATSSIVNQINSKFNQDESLETEGNVRNGTGKGDVGNKPAKPMTMGRDREVLNQQSLLIPDSTNDIMLKSNHINLSDNNFPFQQIHPRIGIQNSSPSNQVRVSYENQECN